MHYFFGPGIASFFSVPCVFNSVNIIEQCAGGLQMRNRFIDKGETALNMAYAK